MAAGAMEFGASTLRAMERKARGVKVTPHGRRGAMAARAVRDAWAWLTGTAYRPERHYMRGGRAAAAGR
jgi:hypothetical protein